MMKELFNRKEEWIISIGRNIENFLYNICNFYFRMEKREGEGKSESESEYNFEIVDLSVFWGRLLELEELNESKVRRIKNG